MIDLPPLDEHENGSIDQGSDVAQFLIGGEAADFFGEQSAVVIRTGIILHDGHSSSSHLSGVPQEPVIVITVVLGALYEYR